MAKHLMIHYFDRAKSPPRSNMKHRGSSPSFRATPPVTGVCSQPCGDGASSLDRLLGCIFCEIRNDPLFFVSPGPENVEIALWEVELSSVCRAALAGGAVKFWCRSEHSSRRRPLGCPPSLIPKQVPQSDSEEVSG